MLSGGGMFLSPPSAFTIHAKTTKHSTLYTHHLIGRCGTLLLLTNDTDVLDGPDFRGFDSSFLDQFDEVPHYSYAVTETT